MPKQMLLLIALAKSSIAHLSKGTLNFEKELKVTCPITENRHENETT